MNGTVYALREKSKVRRAHFSALFEEKMIGTSPHPGSSGSVFTSLIWKCSNALSE
jgi:hypothetical protein